jgi:predicted Rossmann fold flavoprotein
MKKIIVIGAGASGLIAAIFARKCGNDVTILEKNEICGKKLLATGNGRCNFWNENQSLEHYRSSNFDEIPEIINTYNSQEILDFFKNIGIEAKIKNGYYYPFSNQAISMQKALILEAEKQNVKIQFKQEVIDIKKINDKFEIVTKSGEKMIYDKIILSTGSKAAPKTGSDGIGYEICKNFGHSIIEPLPALVQLKAKEPFLKEWEGIRSNVLIKLYENNEVIAEERGEIQLTNYGISGICVFNLSGRVARGLDKNKKEVVEINFLEGLNIINQNKFIEWMNKRNEVVKNRTVFELLEGVLNYKLVNVLLKITDIGKQEQWKKLDDKKRNLLARNIVSFRLNIIGTNSYDKAQVCSGGVPLNELNTHSMESKKVKGLYITGEILDVDGDCGGYNLEWAWITGMIAGRNVT